MFVVGNGRVPTCSHNWLTLDNFFATRPDSHSTISIIAWYLTLKNWNSSVYTHISTHNLTIFEPTWPDLTRPDLTRPFETRSDSYSTNLPLAHSLIVNCIHIKNQCNLFWRKNRFTNWKVNIFLNFFREMLLYIFTHISNHSQSFQVCRCFFFFILLSNFS